MKILIEVHKSTPFETKMKPEKVIILASFFPIFNTLVALLEPYYWLKFKFTVLKYRYKRWKFRKELEKLRKKNLK